MKENTTPNSQPSLADIQSMLNNVQKQLEDTQKKAEKTKKELEKKIANKDATIKHLLHLLYGKKTEKAAAVLDEQAQTPLFELEPLEYPEEQPAQTVEVKGYKKKRKGQRKNNLKDAVHVKKVIEATEEQKICPECGAQMTKIGEEYVGPRVVIVEPQVIVEDIYTETYVCPECSKKGKPTIVKTQPGYQCIPNSFATAEAVAHVINEAFVKAVPYNRQLKEWQYFKIDISRRTLSNWVMYVALTWFQLIVDRMKGLLVSSRYLHADETPVDVFCQDSAGKKFLKKCYVWVYCSIKEEPNQIRIFDFQQGRNGQYAKAFLEDFTGTLITDCYAGYNKVEGVEHAACWAHARRGFVDCLPHGVKVDPELIPAQAILKLQQIFAQEKALNGKAGEEKRQAREKQMLALVDEFFSWVKKELTEAQFSSSKLETALKYCVNHEEALRKVLQDGYIPMTNSLAERAIRPYAIGRMNWCFRGSPRGAQAGALVYSIIETAKANGLNAYKYVLHILKNLPRDLCDMTEEVIDSFLPWNPEVTLLCR